MANQQPVPVVPPEDLNVANLIYYYLDGGEFPVCPICRTDHTGKIMWYCML